MFQSWHNINLLGLRAINQLQRTICTDQDYYEGNGSRSPSSRDQRKFFRTLGTIQTRQILILSTPSMNSKMKQKWRFSRKMTAMMEILLIILQAVAMELLQLTCYRNNQSKKLLRHREHHRVSHRSPICTTNPNCCR